MKNLIKKKFKAVLFDLDGTLIDTAPDMVAVLQTMQLDYGINPSSFNLARMYVSHGAIGLLSHGFPKSKIHYGDKYHQEYLNRYAKMVCVESKLFDGLNDLLNKLESYNLPWGIVTNKPEQLTLSLLAKIGLLKRSSCIVCGDTLSVRKPHPEPILLGCNIIGVNPGDSIYIGDAERDIIAGQKAGCITIAAAYGYIKKTEDLRKWNADIIAKNINELKKIILNLINSED